MALTLLSRGVAVVALVVTARLLSKREFGEVASLVALLGVASLVADFGTSERTVQQAGRTGTSIESALAARVTLGVVVGLVVFVVGSVVVGEFSMVVAATAAAIPPIAVILNTAITDRSNSKPVRASAWNATTALAPVVGAAVGSAFDHTLRGGALGALTVSVVVAAFALFAHRQLPRAAGLAQSAGVAWNARHLALTSICVALYSRGDRLILAAVSGSGAVGSYTAFYTVVFGLSMIGPSLAWTSMPLLAAVAAPAEWRRAVASRLRFAVAAGVGLAVFFLVLGPAIVSRIFGPDFIMGWTAVSAFSLLVFLYVVNPVMSAAVISRDGQAFIGRVAVINAIIAMVIFPAAALVSGATGMVLASLAVEIVGFVLVGKHLAVAMISTQPQC